MFLFRLSFLDWWHTAPTGGVKAGKSSLKVGDKWGLIQYSQNALEMTGRAVDNRPVEAIDSSCKTTDQYMHAVYEEIL